ncbi:MAG: hypothetical protein KI792_03840 [Alphaproteobacteria bacterium]|nr:hypothetical protein [Alphaproteobacteria bacterium SS10]
MISLSTDDTTAMLEAEPDVKASAGDQARPTPGAASLGVPIQKFMFDNAIFDPPIPPTAEELAAAEAKSDEPPPPPPPPGITREELQRARQEAFAEGMAAGLAHAETDGQDRAALALQHIAKIADHLLATDQLAQASAERQIIDGVMAVAEKLAPMLHEDGRIKEIGRFARETLQAHADERELLIAVPTGTAPRIKSELRSVMESRGLTDRVKIVEDESLGPADCRMNWADGGANRMLDRIWSAVENAAGQALAAQGIGTPKVGADHEGDAEGQLADPGPAPAGFIDPEPTPTPAPPAFEALPDWLEQAIAAEPSHIVRELGFDPTAPTVDEDASAPPAEHEAAVTEPDAAQPADPIADQAIEEATVVEQTIDETNQTDAVVTDADPQPEDEGTKE